MTAIRILFLLGPLLIPRPALASENFDPGGLTLLEVKPLAERTQPPEDVAVAVWPSGVIDARQTHYLNRRNLTVVMIAIANPKARAITAGQVVCELPQRVELKAVNANLLWNTRSSVPVERDGKSYLRHVIEVRPSRDTIPKGKLERTWYARYQPPCLWVTTDLPAGSKPGKLYLRLDYVEDGKGESGESPESWEDLAVLPALKADTPRIARSGVMSRAPTAVSPHMNEAHEEHDRLIASYIKQMGCNIYIGGTPQSAAPAGLTRWTEGRNIWQIGQKRYFHNANEPVGVADGFFVHLRDEVRATIPEEIRRLNRDGGRDGSGHISPWAIYRRHAWIQEHVLDVLAQSVERGDYEVIRANWEPRMAKLDYSEGSKEEFVWWSGMPAGEVERLWLDELVEKHPRKWWEFRNWELGQVVKTYTQVMQEAGRKAGRDARLMISTPQDWFVVDDGMNTSCQILRWGDMPYIPQTWSYHHMPKTDRRFPYNDRMGYYMVQRCGWVRRYVDEKFGTDREALLCCAYGWEQVGRRAGYFVPEDLAWRHLSGVMAGLDVARNYAEWTIWDGRYATEMARVNTRIARWEEHLLRGKIQTRHVVVPVSPYPEEIPDDVKPADHEMGGQWAEGYLFSFEYQKNGSRLIAVGNNWHFGDCFLRLKVFDLDANRKHVLWEPEENRTFANARGSVALSAMELADGLLVHAGATRWAAFLVEPYEQGKDYGTAVLPTKVKEVMAQRRADHEAGLKRSAAYRQE